MKRFICAILVAVSLVALCGCSVFDGDKNSIGKSNATVKSTYTAVMENLHKRGKDGYDLYGMKLTQNSENVGRYTFVFTNKRPDNVKYKDILLVVVNNRTGKIEKCSSPNYAENGTEPYDFVSTCMPVDPTLYEKDSDEVIMSAKNAHAGESFVYNYTELSLKYYEGKPIYEVDFISLVNNLVYKSFVDVNSGGVIEAKTEELV